MDPEPGEEIFFHGHPSWRSLALFYAKGLLVALVAGIIAGVVTRVANHHVQAGWVAVAAGEDRREKLVRLTEAGAAKLRQARPAWERAQEHMQSRLPGGVWSGLLATLPDLARLAKNLPGPKWRGRPAVLRRFTPGAESSDIYPARLLPYPCAER